MKKIIAILVLFMGCTHSETTKIETNEHQKLDSIIQKSNENREIISGANKKSDSLVTGKINRAVNKIQHLETEVKQLKAENNELKIKLIDANDDGKSFRIRAISNN